MTDWSGEDGESKKTSFARELAGLTPDTTAVAGLLFAVTDIGVLALLIVARLGSFSNCDFLRWCWRMSPVVYDLDTKLGDCTLTESDGLVGRDES